MRAKLNKMNLIRVFAPSILFILTSSALADTAAITSQKDLTDLSLEDLMEVKVTSVSKRDQSAGEVPAALFVLSNEDIVRSGARSIPEVLRLVPGLHVAQIDTNRWAISARGMNSLFANKLLVLIDGRSVYTPLFSGVYWDAQDTRLEDIERIEVIRGPGASIWGANAVNGVINIITKNSKDTLGSSFTGGVGSEERGFASARYGAQLSKTSSARLYAKYFNRDRSAQIDGEDAYDQWESGQGGGRFDYQDGKNSLTISGDLYKGNNGLQALIASPYSYEEIEKSRTTNYDGNNILMHWQSGFDDGQKLDAQVYYDKTYRSDLIHGERYETLDFDAQYTMPISKSNDLIFGANYRNINDYLRNSSVITFSEGTKTTELLSGFIQDEARFIDNKLRFTFGTKLETNTYTGFEAQPNARVAWVPSATDTIWAAYSHALRTPSRFDDGGKYLVRRVPGPGDIPTSVVFEGSPNHDSEELNAFELGYRSALWTNYSFDIATFYNNYSNFSNSQMQSPTVTETGLELPYVFDNARKAQGYGLEILNTWKPFNRWTLQGWYSWINVNVDQVANSVDQFSAARNDPHNQAFLRSLFSLNDKLDFDSYIRYVDSVPDYSIPAYIDLTLRIAWHYTPNVEFAIVGANLLHNSHGEYVADTISVKYAEIQRSVLGTVSVKF